MNCKPGDLAYVTAGAQTPGLAGRFVVVIEPTVVGDQYQTMDGQAVLEVKAHHLSSGQSWNCRAASSHASLPWRTKEGVSEFVVRAINDEVLRPIRGNDGEDEILRIAGKPVKEVE